MKTGVENLSVTDVGLRILSVISAEGFNGKPQTELTISLLLALCVLVMQ